MAYSQELKDRFVQMRAAGATFEKISAALDVSKPTLVKWWHAYKKIIAGIEYVNAQALLEKYRLNRQAQLEEIVEELARIKAEIRLRDVSKINISILLELEKNREEKFAARMAEIEKNAEITDYGICKDVLTACTVNAAERTQGIIENFLLRFNRYAREITRKPSRDNRDRTPPSTATDKEEAA
jgi:transposase